MKTIWDRIYAWLAANAPVVTGSLRPGASEERIRQTERALAVTFPEDVRAAYRMHDGQRDDASSFEGFCWVPLERVLALWRILKEALDAGDLPVTRAGPLHRPGDPWWDVAWIPL